MESRGGKELGHLVTYELSEEEAERWLEKRQRLSRCPCGLGGERQ
jgi:hypothetical protein